MSMVRGDDEFQRLGKRHKFLFSRQFFHLLLGGPRAALVPTTYLLVHGSSVEREKTLDEPIMRMVTLKNSSVAAFGP